MIWFVRRTNSYNLAKGIIVLLIVLGLSYVLGLTMINFLLRNAVELGLIALVILFPAGASPSAGADGPRLSSRTALPAP